MFQEAITNYSEALSKSIDGYKQDTAIKNSKRAILVGYLTDLANYVNGVVKGDLLKLEVTGFPLTKVPKPVGILPPPKSFEISEGNNSGEMKIKIGIVNRASGYIVFYAKVPPPAKDSEWYTKTFSKTTGFITGLVSEKKYVFKAAATSAEANKTSFYHFTESIEKVVQ